MERDRSTERLGALHSRWRGLDRDWQSVVVGAVIVAGVALGVDVPW